MSRLWAITCIILAAGVGLIAGILLVMFLIVLPRSSQTESPFLANFPLESALRAAGPPEATWTVTETGTAFQDPRNASVRGRRFLAECRMPNTNDQNAFPNKLQQNISTAMAPYGGMIYVLPGTTLNTSGVSVAASPPPSPPEAKPQGGSGNAGQRPQHHSFRSTSIMNYACDDKTGNVHLICIGEGERFVVTIIIQEN